MAETRGSGRPSKQWIYTDPDLNPDLNPDQIGVRRMLHADPDEFSL
jgi:hypothetical protein